MSVKACVVHGHPTYGPARVHASADIPNLDEIWFSGDGEAREMLKHWTPRVGVTSQLESWSQTTRENVEQVSLFFRPEDEIVAVSNREHLPRLRYYWKRTGLNVSYHAAPFRWKAVPHEVKSWLSILTGRDR